MSPNHFFQRGEYNYKLRSSGKESIKTSAQPPFGDEIKEKTHLEGWKYTPHDSDSHFPLFD